MSVSLEQVSVVYDDGTSALRDVCLSLERHSQQLLEHQETIALIGPSGSGKSTLLRVLSMALAPSRGRISLEGENPWQRRTAGLQRMRRRIHLCSQSSALPARQRVALAVLSGVLPTRSLAFTLRCLVSPARSDIELAHGLLSRLNVQEHLWRPVEMLSGGQRQRVAIARAMASEADYLFLDEPLSALDPSTSGHCLEAIVWHARQNRQSLVCSLHQVDLARSHFSRIIGLRQGRVFFDTPAGELDDDKIESLYRGHESEIQV